MRGLSAEAKILGAIVFVTIVFLFGGIFLLAKNQASDSGEVKSAEVVNIDYSKGQKIGSDSAKVRLVEFSDFQCPACLAWESTIRQILGAKHENFQFIYRYFPLTQIHKNSMAASVFSQFAAENGKFWEIHNKLFDTQSQWQDLADPADFFSGLAKEVGLDDSQVKEALKNQQLKDVITADANEGESLGVDSTPTFFLNGHKLDLKANQDLIKAVEDGLKQ